MTIAPASMVQAMGRIEQIQSTLLHLSGAQSAAPSAVPSAAFAQSLASALGTSGTGGIGAAGGASVANPGGATGSDVVASASKYLGVPYVFGGEDSSGMDCSGLVQRVYADLGINVPRLVSGQMTIGTEVGSLASAKPGDLIVTGGGDHILIYAGNNKVIHAPYEGRTVSRVDAYMTDADITTIRRVIPEGGASAAGLPNVVGGTGVGGNGDLLATALASLGRGVSR